MFYLLLMPAQGALQHVSYVLISFLLRPFSFQHLSHEEAVRSIRSIPNPVVASKKLVDLAQSYGAKENLAVIVVRFNFQRKIQHISHNSQQRPKRETTLSTNTSSSRNERFSSFDRFYSKVF